MNLVRRDACDRSFLFPFFLFSFFLPFFLSFSARTLSIILKGKKKWQKNTVVTSQLYVVNITISNIMSLLTGESFSLARQPPQPGGGQPFLYLQVSEFNYRATSRIESTRTCSTKNVKFCFRSKEKKKKMPRSTSIYQSCNVPRAGIYSTNIK